MPKSSRKLVVVAGSNGAGKSTSTPALVRDLFGVQEYVNADTIAAGLSGFNPGAAAISAGRIMLGRLHSLAEARLDFSFETTLASRSFAAWIANLRRGGYRFSLVYFWLSTPELALARVKQRVHAGGHDVPESIVRRRYERGLKNFFELYRPMADEWRFFDNSVGPKPRLVSQGGANMSTETLDRALWKRIEPPADTVCERAVAGSLPISSHDIQRAVARGAREARLRHKLLGQSIYEWHDGRVVEIPPDQIELGELDD